MTRYFFHVDDGGSDRDRVGIDLADAAAARLAAVRHAGDMLREDPGVLWDGHELRVNVTDEAGTLLFTVVTLAVDARGPDAGPLSG